MPRLALVGFAILAVLACESFTEIPVATFESSLAGANVRPTAVTSGAGGNFTATLSTAGVVAYTLELSGLSGVTGVHVHGPADTGQTSGIVSDLGAIAGGDTGTLVSTEPSVSADSLLRLLSLRLLYLDVHTSAHPNGEIRGQIVRR